MSTNDSDIDKLSNASIKLLIDMKVPCEGKSFPIVEDALCMMVADFIIDACSNCCPDHEKEALQEYLNEFKDKLDILFKFRMEYSDNERDK